MRIDRTVLVQLLVVLAAALATVIMLSRRVPAESDASHSGSSRSALGRLLDILTIAVWFGLATGAIQVLLALINRYARNRFLLVGPQMFWMTPVSYVLVFGAIGAIPAFLSGIQSRMDLRRWAFPVFAGIGVFSLLLPFSQLHQSASALIAAGVGLQIGRAMAARLSWWVSVMRWSVVRGAIAVLVVAAASEGWPIAAERYALSRLPTAPDSAPNVLLIVLDTVRAESLSVYGYHRPTTPGLERLAHEGTTFDFAMSTAPWTLKSHGSMFTGLYPEDVQGDFEHPVAFTTPVLAEEFRKRGYVTAGKVDNLLYASRESGLDHGFVHYADYQLSIRQLFLHSWIAQIGMVRQLGKSRSGSDLWKAIRRPALKLDFEEFNQQTYGRRPAGDTITAFLDWQTSNRGQPFFAFLNLFNAHAPYYSPVQFQRRFLLAGTPKKGAYDAAIAYMDTEIDRLLAELEERKLLANTIVVVTSDHGEQFQDHGLTQHANSLYMQVLHVPLLIRFPPAVPAGVRVPSAVTLRDLPATIARLAGLPGAPFPGSSLTAFWNPDHPTPTSSIVRAALSNVRRPRPGTPAFFGDMQAVFDQQFHYILRGDGAEELFDYRADPAETSDLSKTPAGRDRMADLRRSLKSR